MWTTETGQCGPSRAHSVLFCSRKRVNDQISYFLAITTKPSGQVNVEEGRSRRINVEVGGGLGEVEEA